ncbi:MAG: trypsin-like peptidase domain-containing protein [Elusimicrobiota bacterium]
MRRLLMLFAFAGILALAGMPLCTAARHAPAPEPGDRAVDPRGALLADEKSTISLFRKATDSVVYITSLAVGRDFFSFNVFEIPQGTGSGFIWDEDGHVVTNYHVIRNADAFKVTLADHSVWDARLVGSALHKDLAVLKIDAPEERLKPIPVGASNDLQVGQKVYAIGNPFGLDQTLTTGIISALGREIQSVTRRPITGVIQTDAAINPGNSGGPLLDSAGRLIGVNTAIYSPSGAFAGVGFAMPVDTMLRIIPQLIRHGKVIRPGLGVILHEDYLAERIGVKGVLIQQVGRRSAAAGAGLRATRLDRHGRLVMGDVIVGLDGKGISTTDDLYKALDEREVGQSVAVTVLREGREREVKVRLQALE